MEYEVVMGLEVHVELGTKTKLFCSCPNTFTTEANTFCCPKCAGLPGAVGTLNEKAIELAAKAGMSLNCTIQNHSTFDRKHYFYPDLASAYQTTQFNRPICVDGRVDLSDGSSIGIKQIHIEEDAGKLVHDPYIDASYVDYNRSSRCLIEIVSQPDFRNKEQVLEYLDILRSRLIYAEVSPCKMEEGIMRCDINLSVRPMGQKELGVRTEIKNMASFRSIERAIESETKRHIKCIENGEKLIQETRGWNDETGLTFAMREKEYAVDYRYFPDPELPEIIISDEMMDKFKADIPEFPEDKKVRYPKDYGLSDYDTEIIIGERKIAELFENTAKLYSNYKALANWIITDLQSLLKEKSVEDVKLSPENFAALLKMVDDNIINTSTGKTIFARIIFSGENPKDVVDKEGLGQISDDSAIRELIVKAIADNPNVVADYKGGKEKALTFFVGQIMKATKGKSNPKVVNEILKEELAKC